MNVTQHILFLISAVGAFNGPLLSAYLFLSKKMRSIPSFFLSLLVLVISLRVMKSALLYFMHDLCKIYLQIGLSACFLIGPSLYHFLKASLNKVTTVPRSWKLHWGILLGIVVLGGIAIPYRTYPALWNKYIAYLIYGQWSVYLIICGFLCRNLLKTFFTRRKSLNVSERFWLLVYGGNCVIFLTYLLAAFRVVRGMYISGGIVFSFFLYLSFIFYLYSARMANLLQVKEEAPPENLAKKKIADTDAQLWLDKLNRIITEKQLYKDANLKLSDLAATINISAHLLSQLLNDNLGKSFSTYINEYRINEACKLITTNDRLTFEAIGYQVGYNSKSTFYAAFKKIKDTTPALFKESIVKIGQ